MVERLGATSGLSIGVRRGQRLLRAFVAGKVEYVLPDTADRAQPVGKQELPVPPAEAQQEAHLPKYEERVERHRVHLAHGLVVTIVRNGGAHDELTHVEVVVVFCQQHAVLDALLVVWCEVQGGAQRDLQGAGQAANHHSLDLRDCVVQLLLGLPIIADHDGQVRVHAVPGHPLQAVFHVLQLVALVQKLQGLLVCGLVSEQNKSEVSLTHEPDSVLVKVLEAGVYAEVAAPLVKTAVDEALGELPSLLAAVPDTRVVKDLLDPVPIDQVLVFIEAALDRHHGEGQVGAVVAAEGALAEHAVANHATGVGARGLQEITVLVGIVFPTDQVTVHDGGAVQRLHLAEVTGGAHLGALYPDEQPLLRAGQTPALVLLNVGYQARKYEVDMAAADDKVRGALLQRLLGHAHGVVAGHDQDRVRQQRLELIDGAPVKLHDRGSALKNHYFRLPRHQIIQPLLVGLELRVGIIPINRVPAVLKPGGCLRIGHG